MIRANNSGIDAVKSIIAPVVMLNTVETPIAF